MASPSFLPTTTSTTANLASSLASQQAAALAQKMHITQTSIEELRQAKRQRRQWTIVVGSVAGIAMVTALAVMVMEASVICYLAFGIPLVVAPWAVVQRRLLNKAPTLRGQIAVCKEQAARLAQLNLHFGKENDRLGRQVQRFQQMQTQLNETVQRQGGDVQQVRALIKEHGKIQKQMAKVERAQQVQQLFKAVLAADANGDSVLTEEEFERLMMRLEAFNIADKARMREAMIYSSMGKKSIMSLHRDLEQELLEDDPYMSTRKLDVGGMGCTDDSPFVYQSME